MDGDAPNAMGSPELEDHDAFVIESVCRAPRAVTLDMPAATAVTAENGMAAQVDDTHKCASPWFDAPATPFS
jgi:hypothetical protein